MAVEVAVQPGEIGNSMFRCDVTRGFFAKRKSQVFVAVASNRSIAEFGGATVRIRVSKNVQETRT